MEKKKKKNSKGLKVFLTIVIILAAGALGFSAYKLIGINQSYQDANNLYQDVENLFETRAAADASAASGETKAQETIARETQAPETKPAENAPAESPAQTETDRTEGASPVSEEPAASPEASPASEETATGPEETAVSPQAQSAETADAQAAAPAAPVRYASLQWDFQKLLDVCEDGVGYIYQEGTPISYPIVQAENNDKYLRHMINGEYNIAGSIFVDCNFPEGLNGRYSFIYGHNMDDKSMFGSITAYKDEAYYKQHPEFEIYVGDDCYIYYVFSAFQPAVTDFVFTYDFESDEDFVEKMQQARALCPYETDAPEITKDSVVTFLSTCIDYPRDYNYRYIVMLVRGEKIENGTEQSIRYSSIPWAVLDHTSPALLQRLEEETQRLHGERFVKMRGNTMYYILNSYKYNNK